MSFDFEDKEKEMSDKPEKPEETEFEKNRREDIENTCRCGNWKEADVKYCVGCGGENQKKRRK